MRASAFLAAYGACVEVVASDHALLADLLVDLPRGWDVAAEAEADGWRFSATREGEMVRTVDGGGVAAFWPDIRTARAALREELRRYVGFHAPGLLFVHAGVVAYRGFAIVLPAASFAGKSTLVSALVSAGAEFYSDEYAIFAKDGRVIQYREPLIARGPKGRHETEIVAEGPDRPLPVGLVVVTAYREGANWAPHQVGAAHGITAIMEHANRARSRAREVMAMLKLALTGSQVWVGERGDAATTASAILELADQHARSRSVS